ncbi:hypothetical protein [Winogradskyella ursingii]|uniref:hypothetical protein n=1 Tax=Winogradskyella ursingii TaxID=2686079 RepID=UPI0015CED200|nr:hypothetical protein [Winogradskyella ursingii]
MKAKAFFIYYFFIITLFSCHQKESEIVITDFSHEYEETLYAAKKSSYTTSILKVNGFVNDTVLISFGGINKKIKGDLDLEIKEDYYGGLNMKFKFEPLNATDGKLKIKYGIY